MTAVDSGADAALAKHVRQARAELDAHTVEIIAWHFHEATGCPFWLDRKKSLKFDPLSEIKCFDDLKKFEPFQDEWLRGGPVRRWVPKPYADKPIYVFETGGTTGIPKSRIAHEDFRIDYSLFSRTLPDEHFPPGSNWLMLGPSGPRRLRLAVEHLAQVRGGICFCVDLDPRWVVKLIKKGWMEHLEAYKQHCIDQALTILSAGHDIRCMFTTPKLLESLATALEKKGSSIRESGITGIFSGGTEFTPQWTRFAVEEFLDGVYMTPTYGNTLMGLACSKPVTREDGYKISYFAPQPRAVIEVVEFKDNDRVVEYGQSGRVKLTTLTREFFMPGFMERDEGEREPPYVQYPWDGVSGVRPFHELAEAKRQPLAFTKKRVLNYRAVRQGGPVLGREAIAMLNIPVLRWGKPYESLEVDQVVHFMTGEPIAKVSQANGGLLERDLRKAQHARDALRKFSCDDLIERVKKAGELYLNATLPLGDGKQSPEEFARQQSASTGLPVHMCAANMQKNFFVLSHMREMLDALTRGLPLDILTNGYGVESRGVTVSYQAQSPVLGLVLPSNSPGVHTLWLPVIPMQVGLVLKPGPQEPWTPYRMAGALVEAGIPAEAISIYPGGADVGAAVLAACGRSMIFGGEATVERYKGNPRVQAHGPGFSKVLLGDDVVDRWEDYIDLMVDSIYLNSGRGCINCSGVWASRHTREIAAALASRLGPVEVKPPDDPQASLAAFTVPGVASAVWKSIEADLREEGVEHMTGPYGPRLIEMERCAYLRPTIIHCRSPQAAVARKEFMFPFATVVECPQERMIESIGPTLVCSAITDQPDFKRRLIDATHIDRLNIGPIPTIKLDWLQPHEGNIVEFLFRARAFQIPKEKLASGKT